MLLDLPDGGYHERLEAGAIGVHTLDLEPGAGESIGDLSWRCLESWNEGSKPTVRSLHRSRSFYHALPTPASSPGDADSNGRDRAGVTSVAKGRRLGVDERA
jgi:hypothetical protein